VIAVLDASAAMRTVMDPGTPFGEDLSKADLVMAPELIVAEACSAFRKYVCANSADNAFRRAAGGAGVETYPQ